MKYESLYKIYYKFPESHNRIYTERFYAPNTRHFNFTIREYNHQKEYPAFFCYTEEFAVLVEEIYQKHEKLLYALSTVPHLVLEQFILSCVVDEVRATSDIEGIHSTRREIKDVITGTPSARFSSIVGKYKSILNFEQLNFKTCADIRFFYDEFIHKEIVMDNPSNKLDGKLFRKDSVDIASKSGETIHRGAYPEEKIIQLMDVALQILNFTDMPLLAKVAIFHYLFEYIHPFYDGNGRTARFIVSYFLANRFNFSISLRLSVLIKKNRKKYYELFKQTDSEWNCGDLTPFVLGFTKIISETFDDIINILDNKIIQLTKYRYEYLPKFIDKPDDKLLLKIYEILLNSSVFFGGGISMEGLMKETGKSRNTIKGRLNSMPENHLIKISGKKILYKLNLIIFKD